MVHVPAPFVSAASQSRGSIEFLRGNAGTPSNMTAPVHEGSSCKKAFSNLGRSWAQIWENALIAIELLRRSTKRKASDLTQIPIIIPLIVAGAFLGSTWRNKSLMGSWKKAILAGTVSGLLNAGYFFALGLLGRSGNGLTPSQQALPTSVSLPSSSSTAGGLSSILACALTGFLVVMVVYVSAIAGVRYRRGETLESEE